MGLEMGYPESFLQRRKLKCSGFALEKKGPSDRPLKRT